MTIIRISKYVWRALVTTYNHITSISLIVEDIKLITVIGED